MKRKCSQFLSALLLGSALLSTTVLAQNGAPELPPPPAGWLARAMAYLDPYTKVVPDELVEPIASKLYAIENVFLRTDALGHLSGFEGLARYWVSPRDEPAISGGTLYESQLSLMFAPKILGDLAISRFIVMLNPSVSDLTGNGGMWMATGEDGAEIYVEAEPGNPFPGATNVYGELPESGRGQINLVFTQDGVSPWEQVTQERFLKAMLFQTEGPDQSNVAGAEDSMTPYQEWMSHAEERKELRDAAIAAAPDKATADEIRRMMDEAERQATESLKAEEASDAEQQQSFAATVTDNPFRTQLESMSPAERAAPAWSDGIQLVAADAPNARRLVIFRPGYYAGLRSPIEARAMIVQVSMGEYGYATDPAKEGWGPIDATVYRAFQQVDWAALKSLLGSSQ